MLNNALAGRNRSASDVSRFRLSSVKLRNHEVGYFNPLLWAVRVTIFVETFCIVGRRHGVFSHARELGRELSPRIRMVADEGGEEGDL